MLACYSSLASVYNDFVKIDNKTQHRDNRVDAAKVSLESEGIEEGQRARQTKPTRL